MQRERRGAGRPLHLPARTDRFLTVTNAANHEKDLAWFRATPASFDVEVHDRLDDYAMLAVQGPGARALVAGAHRRRAAQAIAHRDGHRRRRARRSSRGTGYTGEDGVELLCAPERRRPRSGTPLTEAGARPAGLGARDTLRLEVCFHLYGNDLMEGRGPIEAGLGWCCKEDTGFIGAEIVRARARAAARPRGSSRSCSPAGDRPPGQPGRRRRGVTSGTLSPMLGIGIGMAYLPADEGRARDGVRDRRARQDAPRRGRAHKPLYSQGERSSGRRPATRRTCKYHAEHDWARIEGDTATFGITWYAQDQLGEVVFFDPPAVGATVAKDQPYAEVESVKAVSRRDRAAVSGEVVEVNEALARRARRTSTTTPTARAGWSGCALSDPSEADELMDADAYEESL